MLGRKIYSVFAAFILSIAASLGVMAMNAAAPDKGAEKMRVETPLNLAILVQDDLDSRVGSELKVTREFIRSLPAGSRVMVAYITTGSLRVRQPFTDDLEKAAESLRTPLGNSAAAPFNPYVE